MQKDFHKESPARDIYLSGFGVFGFYFGWFCFLGDFFVEVRMNLLFENRDDLH